MAAPVLFALTALGLCLTRWAGDHSDVLELSFYQLLILSTVWVETRDLHRARAQALESGLAKDRGSYLVSARSGRQSLLVAGTGAVAMLGYAVFRVHRWSMGDDGFAWAALSAALALLWALGLDRIRCVLRAARADASAWEEARSLRRAGAPGPEPPAD